MIPAPMIELVKLKVASIIEDPSALTSASSISREDVMVSSSLMSLSSSLLESFTKNNSVEASMGTCLFGELPYFIFGECLS